MGEVSLPRRGSGSDGAHVRTALLLAAGLGSRLAPLTYALPKCLVTVNGMPILERLVRTLDTHGIDRLVIVAGYRAEMIRDYLGESFGGIAVEYILSPLYATTNTIYSLWLARAPHRRTLPAHRKRRRLRPGSSGAAACARPDRDLAAAAMDERHHGHARRGRHRQRPLLAAARCLRSAQHRPRPLHHRQPHQPRARHLGRGPRAPRPVCGSRPNRCLPRHRVRRDDRSGQLGARGPCSSPASVGTRSTRRPTAPRLSSCSRAVCRSQRGPRRRIRSDGADAVSRRASRPLASPGRPMLSLARDLPNLCSLTALLASLLGIYFALRGVYPAALIALLWAVVFDWSDGRLARAMKEAHDRSACLGRTTRLTDRPRRLQRRTRPAPHAGGAPQPLVRPRRLCGPCRRSHAAQLLQRVRTTRRFHLPGAVARQQHLRPRAPLRLRAARLCDGLRHRPVCHC